MAYTKDTCAALLEFRGSAAVGLIDGDGLHRLVSTMSRGKADCVEQKLVLCDHTLPL